MSDEDQYASVPGYFQPASFWPVHDMTVSAWIRYTGLVRLSSFAFSMIAGTDTNHIQPFIINVWQGQIQLTINLAQTSIAIPYPYHPDRLADWNKYTVSYTTTGIVSKIRFYVNGTLLQNATGNGGLLRWADQSTMAIGSYSTAPTSVTSERRFIGSIDELAFYNRVLTDNEVASTWLKGADTNDTSLVIYYDFDEGPGADTIKNHGVAGAQADLQNGKIFGGPRYLETVSAQLRSVSTCSFVPGAPVMANQSTPPIVVSLTSASEVRISLTCQSPTDTLSTTQITALTGKGRLFQSNNGQRGVEIMSFPKAVSSPNNAVFYVATNVSSLENLNYTATCNGVPQMGQVVISTVAHATARSDISLDLALDSESVIFLGTVKGNGALFYAEITMLPTLGTLYQVDMANGLYLNITSVPTVVMNVLMALRYVSDTGLSGMDTIGYRIWADGIGSEEAVLEIKIQSWNYPPVVLPFSSLNIVTRSETVVELTIKDTSSGSYLGAYITELPTKGKLYQYNDDGTKGKEIDQAYSAYRLVAPTYQYASKVLNVSSFWGKAGASYNPIQTLGVKDAFTYGDSPLTWSPLTADGEGGMQSGGWQNITFKNDPDASFLNLGYTEYLELGFVKKVYISELLIGENRGMGAIKNILAMDPYGRWMPVYTTVVTSDVQLLFDKFKQYREFRPSVCGTPFLTNHLRFEMDTRTVPDWQEWDFFRLGGTVSYDRSAVDFKGDAVWKVIYVPDPTSSGVDSFSYSATDCPGTADNWSPNEGSVQMNIVPNVFSGEVVVPRYEPHMIDLSQWSVNSQDANQTLEFIVTELPASGSLVDEEVSITSVPHTLAGKALMYTADSTCAQSSSAFKYSSSDVLQTNTLEVDIKVNCPRKCDSEDLSYTVADTCNAGYLKVSYVWNPTTISSEGCAPSSTYPLPEPYNGIPCGDVPLDSTSGALVIFFGCLVGALGFSFMTWLYVYRNTTIVKLTQAGHTAVFCLGGIFLQFSWMTYLGPVTKINCMARPWLLGVAYSIMFGALVRKITIALNVLNNSTKMVRGSSKFRNQFYSAIFVLCCILIDCVILIPWTLISPSVPTDMGFTVPLIPDNVIIEGYECGSSETNTFTLVLGVGFKVGITILGAMIAFKARALDSIVGESTMMLYSTYNFLVSGILLLLISFVATIEPSIWLVVTSVISCFAVTFAFCLLFIPKIQMLYQKIEINPSEVFGGTMQNKKSKPDKSKVYMERSGGDPELYTSNVEIQVAASEKQKQTMKSPNASCSESKIQTSHENVKIYPTKSQEMSQENVHTTPA
eukprot:CAMPEP_0119055568 /NCGR_PEP_ID=MMETSP1177-20130426/75791_1 /TAXON_ID=2985 /ORGANISM="Ochromonas sp, Strain CCMP1899" /LENGTH=1294 /DNA_ID=CAMNT_0007036121 /DNA_START=125 /DNA_END=4009 /DNA_ORIENTATION=-